jgi:hypothetical protein
LHRSEQNGLHGFSSQVVFLLHAGQMMIIASHSELFDRNFSSSLSEFPI